MTHIKDISETIMIETTTDAVKVTLNAKQYQLDRLEQYQLFLTQKKTLALWTDRRIFRGKTRHSIPEK